jgi:hypothetical protein
LLLAGGDVERAPKEACERFFTWDRANLSSGPFTPQAIPRAHRWAFGKRNHCCR